MSPKLSEVRARFERSQEETLVEYKPIWIPYKTDGERILGVDVGTPGDSTTLTISIKQPDGSLKFIGARHWEASPEASAGAGSCALCGGQIEEKAARAIIHVAQPIGRNGESRHTEAGICRKCGKPCVRPR